MAAPEAGQQPPLLEGAEAEERRPEEPAGESLRGKLRAWSQSGAAWAALLLVPLALLVVFGAHRFLAQRAHPVGPSALPAEVRLLEGNASHTHSRDTLSQNASHKPCQNLTRQPNREGPEVRHRYPSDFAELFQSDAGRANQSDGQQPLTTVTGPEKALLIKEYQRAYATTRSSGAAGGWVRELVVGGDLARVYKTGKKCSVVFAGTNYVWIPTEDCQLMSGTPVDIPECKLTQVFSCYKKETFLLLKAPGWNSIATYLASNQCSGGVTSNGYSLGGSIATVFATCANNAKGNKKFGWLTLEGVKVKFPRVSQLVTFGSPPMSPSTQPLNAANNGVFPGYRVWSERGSLNGLGTANVDDCSWWPKPGYHAKMEKAVAVRRANFGPGASFTAYGPTTKQSTTGALDYPMTGFCPSQLHGAYASYLYAVTATGR